MFCMFIVPIISGWNLSWSEGATLNGTLAPAIISGWNLSWSEGYLVKLRVSVRNYIRLESELE